MSQVWVQFMPRISRIRVEVIAAMAAVNYPRSNSRQIVLSEYIYVWLSIVYKSMDGFAQSAYKHRVKKS